LVGVTAHDIVTFDDVKLLAGASGPCITVVMQVPNPLELPGSAQQTLTFRNGLPRHTAV
jgi:hypothetical protein